MNIVCGIMPNKYAAHYIHYEQNARHIFVGPQALEGLRPNKN
jgi:hypothetical protein